MQDKKQRMIIVGVMGGSVCSDDQALAAYEVGKAVAEAEAVLLCGGGGGVMKESAKGAFEKGGLTLGILPGDSKELANEYIRIALPTNMGDARNAINILSTDIVVAIGGASGTLSEISFAIKGGKQVLAYDSCRPIFSGGMVSELFCEFTDMKLLIEEMRKQIELLHNL